MNDLSELLPFSAMPFIRKVTVGEFDYILASFKDKASGESGVTKLVLKNCPRNVKQILTNIFNVAILSGYFPGAFKRSIIIMIPKTEVN